MPNFNLSQQPQYPIVTKDTDIALTLILNNQYLFILSHF